MYIKKLINYVQKNYIFFSESEVNNLLDFNVNEFFLSFFTKVNLQKNNKKLVKIWVKIFYFKEKYKENPCEFFYKFCKKEEDLIKWYKFFLSISNVWKLYDLFSYRKEKYWQSALYKKYYWKFAVIEDKLKQKYETYEKEIKYKLSIQHLERLIHKKDFNKAKLYLKKLVWEYPDKLSLYDYFSKINKLVIADLKKSIESKEFEELSLDIKWAWKQWNEKYSDLNEKQLLEELNKLLNEEKTDEWIKLANWIIKNKKVKQIKKVIKLKNKLVNLEIDHIRLKQISDFEDELKLLEKLIEDRRIDRLLWVVQWIFAKYEFVDKKPLKKYIPLVFKIEKEIDVSLLGDWMSKIEKFFMRYAKLSQSDLYFVYDKMAWFMKAQVDIKMSLNILKIQANTLALKKLIFTLIHWINTWYTMTDILAQFKEIPHRDISMLKVSEQVWWFETTFESLKQIYEDSIYRKKKIKSMMIYPLVSIVISLIIMVLMLIWVFPKFILIYNQFWIDLPLPTKIMLFLSDFLRYHWLISIIIVIWFTILLKVFMWTKLWKIFKSRLLLHFPIISEIYKKAEILHFLENLSMMTKGWLPITKIVDYLIDWVDNYFFKKELTVIKMLILTWDSFAKAMGVTDDIVSYKSSVIPIEIAYWIKVWEDTWKLAEVLDNLFVNYKKEFHLYMENLQQVLEPLLVLVIWWMVFILVLSIFLPMMWIYHQISKQVKF